MRKHLGSVFLRRGLAGVLVSFAVVGCVGFERIEPNAADTVAGDDDAGEDDAGEDDAGEDDGVGGDDPEYPETTLAGNLPEVSEPGTTIPGVPPTTDARGPMNCDTFTGVPAFERMRAVDEGNAPDPDSDCGEAVEAATASANVFNTSRKMYDEFGLGKSEDNPGVYLETNCDDTSASMIAQNTFDQPVIFWGAVLVGTDDAMMGYAPVISDVVQPGGSETITADISDAEPEWDVCFADMRVLLAPEGEMAPDQGLVPIPEDDPQSADDAATWYPALLGSSKNMYSQVDPTDWGNAAVADVEDLHSPDLVVLLGGLDAIGGGEPERPADARRTVVAAPATAPSDEMDVCYEADVTSGRDEVGKLRLLTVYSDQSSVATTQLGLYRRGSDGRWRYVGRTVNVSNDLSSTAGCDAAAALGSAG